LAVDDLRAGTAWSDLDTGHRSRIVSHQDEDIYVSVEDGDDANSGRSMDDAYETINRALADVPKFCYHSISIHIDYGDYRGQDGPRIFHIHQTARSRDGDTIRGSAENNELVGGGLKLWGHVEYNDYYDESRTVEDIVFAYGLDSGCSGSEELTVWGITIDGKWQSYDSAIRFRRCLFKGGAGPEGKQSLIGGHRCNAAFWQCDFKDSLNISRIGGMANMVFLGGCGIENVDRPFETWGLSIICVMEDDWNLLTDPPMDSIINGEGWIMNHPKGSIQQDGGTQLSRGTHTFGDSAVFDDSAVFSDTTGEGSDVVLENRDGDLVAIVEGEETILN
jgi:hypothetical protein